MSNESVLILIQIHLFSTQKLLTFYKNILISIVFSGFKKSPYKIDIVSKAAKLAKPTTGPVDMWADKLSATELRRWNNVKTVMEFPDGFRWVVALNKDGSDEVGYMPSTITYKTMNHCGNAMVEEGDKYCFLRVQKEPL